MRTVFAAAVGSALTLASPWAWAQRTRAQVVDATHTRAWIDAGRDDGLAVGASWEPTPGVQLSVVAVARHSAALEATRGPLPPRGATVPLPEARQSLPPPPPGPREAPPATAPWDARYALGATPWRPGPRALPAEALDDPFDDDPRHRPQGIRGEVALRLLAGGNPGTTTRGYHDLGVVSQVSAAWGRGWIHDHLVEARVVASPELMFVPLQHPQARLDVYLLRFGYAQPGSDVGVEFGRMATLPGAAVGMTDGARLRWRPQGGHVEVSAFAGARPNAASLVPTFAAPRAGASVRARFGDAGGVRGRLDAALVVDGWNTSVDRVFSTLGAGLDYGARMSLSGEAVLDLAPDAAQHTSPRLTRALVDARVDLLRGALRLQAMGGLDRPLYTASLRAQVPDLPALPVRRFVSLGADLRVHRRLWTFLTARASDDPTGLRALVTDAGIRVLDLPGPGSHASLRARWALGDRLNSLGAHAAWSVLLTPRTHVEAGLGVDRFVFGDNAITTWAYRARLGGDRRFGSRWRGAISYEVSWGAFSPQHLAFVLVAYRLG